MTGFPLVSAEALIDIVGQEGYVIMDATTLLPGDKFDPAEEFDKAHIPGSCRFDIEAFSDTQSSLPHMAPTAGQFSKLIGALGVDAETSLIFYDQKGVASASRAWWLAKLFGHEKCKVLDGGLPAWRAAGGKIASGTPDKRTPLMYRARTRYVKVCGLGDMLDLVEDQGAIILDARSKARFYGEVEEPRPGVRAGHMPGSRNVPYATVLDEAGCFLSSDNLKALFADLEITEDDFVVTTCGSGLTASVLTLALTVAGHDFTALYDGSWAEWGSFPDAPVVGGEC